MIKPAVDSDFNDILNIINDGAQAYNGIIPADRWHDPYMDATELQMQMREGVVFLAWMAGDSMLGVMGMQDRGDVNLIRHAYVRTIARNQGIGGHLLRHLMAQSEKPILIGTWKAAVWAIAFYQKYGFELVSESEKDRLLESYWNIPTRQVETSVVLADKEYRSRA